ncbi:MAG: TonB-dependent receptor plug domain-containing protein, partial [Pseudomonadota bacterium]|nr:TonB-dependent receptor plug domain-containing protein [Pseudomonadota bacterium]
MRLSAVFIALAAGFSGVAHAQTEVTTSDQSDSKELEKIEVVGRAFSLYRPTESSFATRTNTPLEKIPQSIQILPQELISDQAARQITDLYSNIAGVNAFSYSGVTFRGFRQDDILY